MIYRRPELPVRGPNRAPGGYYRTTDGQSGGNVFGGMPVQTTEDAVVAAVRTGYRIADAQIERGMRIAESLRGAAQRAGAGEPKDMLANAESLAKRSMLLMLDWLETLAAQPSSPLKRMLRAEYRLLGGLIGLEPGAWSDLEKNLRKLARRHDERDQDEVTEPESHPRSMPSSTLPVIVFDGVPRAVELVRWQISHDLHDVELEPLKFALSGGLSTTFGAKIEMRPSDGALLLRLALAADTAEGVWKAPVCGPANELFGVVVISL